MQKILLFVFFGFTFTVFSQNLQEKYQHAQINYNNVDDLVRLSNLGIPVDHGIHKRGVFLISDFSESEIETARNAGFTVDILIDDAKEYFLEQNRLNTPFEKNPSCDGNGTIDFQTPVNFGLGTMGGYFTYQEILDQLDLMKSLYPDIITTKSNISNFLTNGQPDASTTPPIGGNGIKWVKISDNPDINTEGEPQILYTAIHHAREPNSVSQLMFYMWYLLENYDSDVEVQSILNNTELYFVPVVNPDGYLYNEKTDPNGGGFWRKNRFGGHGVDNNRNYDYYINGDPTNGIWGGEGTSSDPNSPVYHGSAPFSEIENQALKWFVENHDFIMAFNNHSAGDLLLYPYGYTANTPTPDQDLFEGISEELVSQNGFNNILSSELYAAAGDSDDFMYGTLLTHNSIFAFTPEIGPNFWPPSNQIIPIAKGMMYHNITAAKMVNNYATIKDTAPQFTGGTGNVDASFSIRRLGVVGSGNFTVSINPLSSNIDAVGSPVNYTNMAVLDESNGVIQYTLVAGTNAGDIVSYELIVNNGAYDSAILVEKIVVDLLVVFEDPGDSVSDNFDNNGWGTTTSTYVSPSSSITDSPSGNYSSNANETITLNSPVDLSNAIGASASFYAQWDIENNWDYVQFEVSTNGGGTWIPQCGKFTNSGSSNNSQPTGEPLYDGTQNDWVLEEINLSDYLGENIIVRFQLRSDGSVNEDGFYFDDLTINIVEPGPLGLDGISTVQFSVFPNPVEDLLNITTSVSNYTIELYSLQGTLVERIEHNKGSKSIDYSDLANGVYIVKLISGEFSQTVKIVRF
jgi:hypothetical protein